MQANRIGAIVLRQYYLHRGSLTRVVPLFLWVAIDIVLWGFISEYLGGVASAGFSIRAMLLGAVLLWNFFGRVMQGVTIAFFEDVWSRNFLNMFSTPITIAEYLSGLVVTSIATSLLGLIGMLAVAILFFDLSYAAYGLTLVPLLLILFLFGIALGFIGVAMVLRLGPSAEWFVWPIPAVISPFVGVFYPLSTLPEWMQYLAKILPPSYVFEGVRTILAGGTVAGGDLLAGFILAILYLFLAGWLFAHVYRHAVRTGLIARYSAESAG